MNANHIPEVHIPEEVKQSTLALFPVELRERVQVSAPVWYRVFDGDLAWRPECYASIELGQTHVYACFNPLSGDVYFWSWWDSDTRSWRTSQKPPQHIFGNALSEDALEEEENVIAGPIGRQQD